MFDLRLGRCVLRVALRVVCCVQQRREKGQERSQTHTMSGAPPPVIEKLTLAYRDMFDLDPRIVQQFGPTLKELDLSNNNLRFEKSNTSLYLSIFIFLFFFLLFLYFKIKI